MGCPDNSGKCRGTFQQTSGRENVGKLIDQECQETRETIITSDLYCIPLIISQLHFIFKTPFPKLLHVLHCRIVMVCRIRLVLHLGWIGYCIALSTKIKLFPMSDCSKKKKLYTIERNSVLLCLDRYASMEPSLSFS